jgi:hypothetical protein
MESFFRLIIVARDGVGYDNVDVNAPGYLRYLKTRILRIRTA